MINYKQLTRMWLAAVLAAFFTISTFANGLSEFKFRRIDTRNGLSNSQANCVLKDSRGYVWIGTQFGLNRFDGFRIRSYYSKTSTNKSLKYDFFDDLWEDAGGNIWIRQGVNYCVFNPDTETFDYNISAWLRKKGIAGNPEYIFIDSRKNIWIKPYSNDFYSVSAKTHKVTRFVVSDRRLGLPQKALVCGVANIGKSVVAVLNSGDLVCMNSETGKIDWTSSFLRRHTKGKTINYKIWLSPRGDYWLVSEDGIYIYRQDKKKWFTSLIDMLREDGFRDLPDNPKVWDIHFSGDMKAWFATDHNGLMILDWKTHTFQQFFSSTSDRNTIPDNTLLRLYRANDGSMWICGLQGGVSQCTQTPSIFENYQFGVANAIAQDIHGNYWIGTNDKGIICYNPSTKQSKNYNTHNSGLKSDIMVCMLGSADGSVWAGTYDGGLSHVVNGEVTTFLPSNSDLAIKNIWGLSEDNEGNIWVATLGSGIQKIVKKTGKFISYNSNNKNVSSDYCSSMHMASNGWIVVGTSDYYSIVDPKIDKVVNMKVPSDSTRGLLPSASSTQVVMDTRGLVWYASPSGLSIVDSESGQVTQLDEKNGLESSTICGIVEDLNHNMWVATEFGLAHVVVRQKDGVWTYQVQNYSQQDGLLPGPHNKRSMCLLRDGNILLGGVNGVDVISPMKLRTNVRHGRPVFSGLLLFDKEIGIGSVYDGRVVLKQSLDKSRHLVLRNAERQFTIQMGTNQGLADNNVQFTYRLEGFSDKWITTEPGDPNITFTGLPSGSYTLVVKLAGEANDKSPEERLEIEIMPPFYATWWAYAIYLLIALLLLRLWMRYQHKKLNFERMKMQKENERQQSNIKMEVYSGMSDEMRQPFDRALMHLDEIMRDESDEVKYGKEEKLREELENLLMKMNEQVEQQEKRDLIVPTITEKEITSLDQQLVDKATAYVEQNMEDGDISVETMSEALGMSRVHLYKRLTAVTGQTPSEFMRDIRLRHAERLLRLSQLSVSEVSYKVGFNNPRYFSKYFKDKYGMLPSQYKSQDNTV